MQQEDVKLTRNAIFIEVGHLTCMCLSKNTMMYFVFLSVHELKNTFYCSLLPQLSEQVAIVL